MQSHKIWKWQNCSKKFWLGPNMPNLILILWSKSCIPVVQNELGCSPLADGHSQHVIFDDMKMSSILDGRLQHVIFAACHFREQILGIYQNYNVLWFWCELTSIAFSENWSLEILLRLASCKAIKTIILGTRSWGKSFMDMCNEQIAGLLAWWLKIQSSTLPESPCDKSEERACNTPKGSTDVVTTGASIWSKHPLCNCSVASFGLKHNSSLQALHVCQFFRACWSCRVQGESVHPCVWILPVLTLDKVVWPYLANLFGMLIFHSTTEAEVKELLDAIVDVWVFCCQKIIQQITSITYK